MPRPTAPAAPRPADALAADLEATAARETAELEAKAAAEDEFSFRDVRYFALDDFLLELALELAINPVEHALNPSWPDNRLAVHQKYQERVVQGLVYHALWTVGITIDNGIQPRIFSGSS